MNGLRIFSLYAALALAALILATGSATAGTAGHHPAGPTHAASDADAPSHQAGATADQAGTDTRHCPSDHPMSLKSMTCCMAMVPDQVAVLYRHVTITVHRSRRVLAHDRTIRPPLKPPQPSV